MVCAPPPGTVNATAPPGPGTPRSSTPAMTTSASRAPALINRSRLTLRRLPAGLKSGTSWRKPRSGTKSWTLVRNPSAVDT